MNLEMLSQISNPLGENGNLHFWGSRIAVMQLERTNDLLFFFGDQHVSHTSFRKNVVAVYVTQLPWQAVKFVYLSQTTGLVKNKAS
jgi:hypothetical protein